MSNATKIEVIDMMGNIIMVPTYPERIISLVPSQTELLFELGLEERVIGITKFCIHPNDWFNNKKRVGGTKNPNLEVIRSLKPDLIIGNKEENEFESIHLLAKEFPVWLSDIYNLNDALKMIVEVGKIVGKKENAQNLADQIDKDFNDLKNHRGIQRRKVLYLIWRQPWMAAGKNVFINDMLSYAGFENILVNSDVLKEIESIGKNVRYPILTDEMIESLNPDIILLSSEPFPFKEKHIAELNKICPTTKIVLVDGEAFSWYGSRMKYAAEYLTQLTI